MSIKVVYAGGGSGGHILPLIAIDAEFKFRLKDDYRSLYIISDNSIESEYLKREGLDFIGVPVGKFRRYKRGIIGNLIDYSQQFKNLFDVFKTNKGLLKSIKLLKSYSPDCVLIKGGNAGLIVGLAAVILNIPIYLLESDIVIGTTNKLLVRFCRTLFVSWPIDEIKLNIKFTNKMVYLGTPVDRRFTNISLKDSRNKLLKMNLKTDNNKLNILFLGGSLGSQYINDFVINNLNRLNSNIWHVTGKGKQENKNDKGYHNYSYFESLGDDLATLIFFADIAVSRAGASSIAELATLAKPTIMIPLPIASKNHQSIQAQYLNKEKAILIHYQTELESSLLNKINKLATEPSLREELSKNFNRFSKSNASDNIRDFIIQDLGLSFNKDKVETN